MCPAQGSGGDHYDGEFHARILKVTENRVVPFGDSFNEGQVVKRGEILLVQDTVIARAQMDAAQATVAQQQAQLSERTAGARSEDRAAARARVDRARVQLQVETREWQRLNELVGQKLISDSALARQKGLSDAAAASSPTPPTR